MTDHVSDYELWRLLKGTFETVQKSVVTAATTASGVTDTDIAVLLELDAAGGRLRQAALARALEWDRTRLSHHLTRMASRDLVERTEGDGGTCVGITPEGLRRLAAARPAHLAAVAQQLVEPLGDDDAQELARLLRRVLDAQPQVSAAPGSATTARP